MVLDSFFHDMAQMNDRVAGDIKISLCIQFDQSFCPVHKQNTVQLELLSKSKVHQNGYRNDPKYSDRQASANSVDPDLTHISLASHFWDIGKQCRPRSDAAVLWRLIWV